jgi:hypothetical protein
VIRWVFWLVAVAMAIWMIFALLLTGRSAGDEPTTTDATTPDDTAQVAALQQQLDHTQQTLRRERRLFRKRLRVVIHGRTVGRSWLENAFLCIHAGEGGWKDDTGNGYQGGLQMTRGFQEAYAPWALAAFGTANRWPVTVQIAAGIRAWTSRGFQPWPNTSRACGL